MTKYRTADVLTKCRTIESVKEELEEFEKEEIPKMMSKYQCQNCGNLSDNLKIRKENSSKQLERYQEILNEHDIIIRKIKSLEFINRLAYVECPICRSINYFEIHKNLKE